MRRSTMNNFTIAMHIVSLRLSNTELIQIVQQCFFSLKCDSLTSVFPFMKWLFFLRLCRFFVQSHYKVLWIIMVDDTSAINHIYPIIGSPRDVLTTDADYGICNVFLDYKVFVWPENRSLKSPSNLLPWTSHISLLPYQEMFSLLMQILKWVIFLGS